MTTQKSTVTLIAEWLIHIDELYWTQSTHRQHVQTAAKMFQCPEADCRAWIAVCPSAIRNGNGEPSPEVGLVMMLGKISGALDFNLARKFYMNAVIGAQVLTGPDDNREAEQFPMPAGIEEYLYTAGRYEY